MNFTKILEDNRFHDWHNYEPQEVQYAKYAQKDPSVIAAGHKIVDVYYAYANARASFIFSNSDDFGDIAGDSEISRLYAKTHFLLNAILEYAITLDLSWQVIWAYTQPSSLNYLMERKYTEMEKNCDRESLHSQLKCIIAQPGKESNKASDLLNIMDDFDNNQDVVNLRKLYNKIKHQGTIHFSGLGNNDKNMMFSINGNSPSMLYREEHTIDEIEELLFNYHFKFYEYFEEIINQIIPKEYLENKMDLIDFLNAGLQMYNN